MKLFQIRTVVVMIRLLFATLCSSLHIQLLAYHMNRIINANVGSDNVAPPNLWYGLRSRYPLRSKPKESVPANIA